MKKYNIFKFVSFLLFISLFITINASIAYGMWFDDTTVPNTIGVQLKNEDMSQAQLNKLATCGYGFVRKAITWSSVEKTKGVYDWTQMDSWVNSIETRGLSILMTIVWNNRLYEDQYDRAIVTEEGRQAFAKFASDVVTHYKGKNIVYEIWNEPNLNGFWKGISGASSNSTQMGAEYAQLVNVAVPAMKTADPDCCVAIGSISCLWSDSFRWFNSVVANGALDCGADYISVHPYGFAFPELAMTDGYPVIRETLDSNGHSEIGILNSEVGYDTDSLINRGHTAEEAPYAQAWYMVRQYMLDIVNDIAISNWYEFSETDHWGVVNANLTERPSYTAVCVMNEQLTGYKYRYSLPTDSIDDFLLVFSDAYGNQKLVAWTAPKRNTPSNMRFSTPHTLSVDVGVTGTHTITDTFGNNSVESSADNKLDIYLTGAPVYVNNVHTTAPESEPVSNSDRFPLIDDTYADGGNKTLIRGAQNYIYTKCGETRNIYIKGDISEADDTREIEYVKLYLYYFMDTTSTATINVTARDGGALPVYAVYDNNWSEDTLKWNVGVPVSPNGDVEIGKLYVDSEANNGFNRYYSVDITDFALSRDDGIFTLKITGEPTNTLAYKFKSKECGSESMMPYVEVKYRSPGEPYVSAEGDNVRVNLPDGESGFLVVSEYNDEILTDVKIYEAPTSGLFPVPASMTGNVKAMLLESLDNVKPLCRNVEIR